MSEIISVLISSLEISNPLHYTGMKRRIFLSKGLTDRHISCVHWFLDVRLFDIAYGICFYLFLNPDSFIIFITISLSYLFNFVFVGQFDRLSLPCTIKIMSYAYVYTADHSGIWIPV